jgi:hypothetical protein
MHGHLNVKNTLLHVSTLSCRLQGVCDQCLAKLHKYFKCKISNSKTNTSTQALFPIPAFPYKYKHLIYMVYLLTAIVLTPGGSGTVHIYKQTIHGTTQLTTNNTNNTQKTQTTNLEECWPCPVFASFTLAFALQLREKHGKTFVLPSILSFHHLALLNNHPLLLFSMRLRIGASPLLPSNTSLCNFCKYIKRKISNSKTNSCIWNTCVT